MGSVIRYRWKRRGTDSFLGQVNLPGAGDDFVGAIHESPLQDRSYALILMGDRCGPASRHRMKRNQGRVTESSPSVGDEERWKEENSFHGERLCLLDLQANG